MNNDPFAIDHFTGKDDDRVVRQSVFRVLDLERYRSVIWGRYLRVFNPSGLCDPTMTHCSQSLFDAVTIGALLDFRDSSTNRSWVIEITYHPFGKDDTVFVRYVQMSPEYVGEFYPVVDIAKMISAEDQMPYGWEEVSPKEVKVA